MRRIPPLFVYAAVVCVVAFPIAGWILIGSVFTLDGVPWFMAAVLIAAIAVSEFTPVRLLRNGVHAGHTALGSAFGIALLCVAPPGLVLLAVVLFGTASALKDQVAWYKIAFNVAQYSVIVAAARGIFTLISGDPFFSSPDIGSQHVLAIGAAGLTYLVGNELLLLPMFATAAGQSLPAAAFAAAREQYLNHAVEICTTVLALAAATLFSPLAVLCLVPAVLSVRRSTAQAAIQGSAAWYDPMTGLPNLQLLNLRYLRRRQEAGHAPERLAVLLVDFDGLKGVQTVLGDDAVHLLLIESARRLQCNVRAGDVVVRRFDDFAILAPLDATNAAAELQQLSTRLLACLNEPFLLNGVRVDLQATMGAVLTDMTGESLDLLIKRAGTALQTARKAAPGTLRLHSPADDATEVSTPDQLSLLGELREAISNGQIEVHYQPKVSLADDAVIGLEALARWRHPERGLIFPDKFIPLAEHTGLIDPLTWEVLEQAAAQAGEWHRRAWPLGIAVNFAAAQITREETVGRIAAILSRHRLPPQFLTVEITEGTLLDDLVMASGVLGQLRAMGVRVSIDDYGTGHSSLAYLHQLQPDELKIDRCFVKDLGRDHAGAAPAIVKSTVDLAKHLGIKVVAEGAGDATTVAVLNALGCDLVQGYYYSKPLSGPAVTEWLKSRRVETAVLPRPRATVA